MHQPVQIVARGPRRVAEAAAEAIEARADTLAFSILEEDEDRDVWRIDAFPTSDAEATSAQQALAEFPRLAVKTEPLADADWLAMALSGLPPVKAGRFFIFGVHDRGRAPINAVQLRIEAGAAFGTGHHGTTTGCLIAYDRLLKAKRYNRVLDVGTGTGVLAIAAAKCGAKKPLGTDIDRISVRIARENASVNRVPGRFLWAAGLDHPEVRRDAPYDLVFANILARPLVSLAQSIKGALKPGGIAILSGLLRSQERLVRGAYTSRGFRLVSRVKRDAWCTLVLRRT